MSDVSRVKPHSLATARAASLALVLLLAACTMVKEIHDEQQLDNWAKDNEPRAESGKIAWSDFYSEYLQKASATPTNRLVVERLGILVTASKLYEQGRLDRDGFDAVRGIIRRYQTIDDPAANSMARDALVRALERRASADARPAEGSGK